MALVIVINGPIGAGKSTVAQVLAEEVRQLGRSAAVLDLDVLYLMGNTKRTEDPNALGARRAAAALTDSFLSSGVEIVIVEGPFWDEVERAAFLDNLTWSGNPHFVTLLISYDEAFRRVRGDATRTISRTPEFLKKNHADFKAIWEPLRFMDLVLDSSQQTPQQLATAIAQAAMTSGPVRHSNCSRKGFR